MKTINHSLNMNHSLNIKHNLNINHRKTFRLSVISGILLLGCLGIQLSGTNQSLFLTLNSRLNTLISPFVWQSFTLMGDTLWIAAIMALGLARRERWVLSALLLAIPTTLLVQGIKQSLGVERPPAVFDISTLEMLASPLTLSAFPSGHSATVFLVAAMLITHVKRPLFISLIWLWATLCALSRIAVGVHWPTDILAGAAIGWLFGILVPLLEPQIGKMQHPKRWLVFIAIYLCSVGLFVHDPGVENVLLLQYVTAFLGLIFSIQYCSRRVLRIREDVHVIHS